MNPAMRKTISLLLICFLYLNSCEYQDDNPTDMSGYAGDKKAGELIDADNEFGIDLFRRIASSEVSPHNILISPVSTAIALGMTYNGAEGSTKSAFEETLRLQGFTRGEINTIHKELIQYLISADKQVNLEVANSIWHTKSFNVSSAFIDANRQYYNAEVNSLDFSDPISIRIINNWISENTHTRIQNVLDYLPPDAKMYLINALYYNGLWKTEFNVKNSFTGVFYGESAEIPVHYMKNTNSYSFYENELFSAIELPYGSGKFVMNIFLPHKGKGIDDILEQMTAVNWKLWMGGFVEYDKIMIQIPKFKFQYRSLLNDWLCSMGLEEAFDNRADFSGINRDAELFISRVIHQTFIDVNEKGTEAAAVTVIEIKETSAGSEIRQFIANRPFIFSIREKNTGALLFIGKIGIPAY
jgi:serpin B